MSISYAVICLALNIYFEARGESISAQAGVGYVTVNRANNKDTGICQAVFERGEFSWTRGRKKIKIDDNVELSNEEAFSEDFLRKNKIKEMYAWEDAIEMAEGVINKKVRNPIGKSTHFYSGTYRPYWAKSKKMRIISRINGFTFFKEV
jgi:spore germination cell wall hydrolase CwlJ-like protein